MKLSASIGTLVGVIAGMFLSTWILWLIIPAVTPWELGYWKTMLLYIGSNILFKKTTLLPDFTSLKGK